MRILFLEDEPVIREVLAEYMEIAGHEVAQVSDGGAALECLSAGTAGSPAPFDLAVLDIMVPGIDGMTVLRRIRDDDRTAQMGVIMLTALDDIQTQVTAFNQYADDYIIKPVSPIILLKRIETIVRRVRRSDTGTARGLVIEPEAYRAAYDGEPLPLTLSEFLLLQVLWSAPRRVFTREQLILQIFNEDYIGNDRIIDAHVKNLRKKLPGPFIKTVVGVGYQFNEGAES